MAEKNSSLQAEGQQALQAINQYKKNKNKSNERPVSSFITKNYKENGEATGAKLLVIKKCKEAGWVGPLETVFKGQIQTIDSIINGKVSLEEILCRTWLKQCENDPTNLAGITEFMFGESKRGGMFKGNSKVRTLLPKDIISPVADTIKEVYVIKKKNLSNGKSGKGKAEVKKPPKKKAINGNRALHSKLRDAFPVRHEEKGAARGIGKRAKTMVDCVDANAFA